ncbi:MAG TPA: ATP-binding protein [Candidatus Aminicenantes bacterium]|nr:ATP-binding protein [Candidatus Aminicenantes bacterium]
MPKPLDAFEERLYTEYDLKGRVRMAIVISIVLFLGFLVLDWVYTPQHLGTFAVIRVSVAAVEVALLLLARRIQSNRGFVNLGMAMVVTDAVALAVMIQVMGGFLTSYYQGLNIIVIGMLVVIPFAFRESLFLYSLTWAVYALPSFMALLAGQDPIVVRGGSFGAEPVTIGLWRFVVNNLFFLTSIIFVGAFGSKIMDSIRRRELRNRIELEGMTQQLQESNIKLKSLDELKTQFFANVNHELRTPLTLMLTPLKAALEGRMGELAPSLKDTLDMILRNGYKLLKLINNLLDLSKLEEGRMRLKVRTVNLVEFIPPLLASVKPLADQKQLRLFFQHPAHPVTLTLDPDQFEKVVLNLLSNALKFTPKGGKITIFVEERDGTVVMTVEDTGIGIPDSMLVTIFDRFSQVDGSKSRAQEGTGIGLALAREIVLVHKGRIWAESELGRGSRFIVEMLRGEEHFDDEVLERRAEDVPVGIRRRLTDTEEPHVQDIVADHRGLQLVDLEKIDIGAGQVNEAKVHDALVLCIDDSPEVLKLMKMLLADEFDLELATSAEQGLRLVRDKGPDLILCDVMMPGMDGHAFSKAVKSDEATKHIPIILVTARSGAEMLAEGIKAGADDYISKPFDSTELKARIRALLRLRQVEAELALANRNLRMRTSDLVEQQRSLFLSTVKSLASAIDAKDEYTRHHSTRVTDFSLKIAAKMGFSAKELGDLELAAVLHDVGKIAVPESILNKPGKLSPDEFALIKDHPARGEAILSPVVELKEIARVVRAHHERYDGTGYPDRLKGREIPLGARIMAIADTYDSITSDRPYRKAASHRYALKEIIACSGTQFDPEAVQAFLEIAGTIAQDQGQEA